MTFDDRPDFAKRLEAARVARGFETAKAADTFFGWPYDTYAQHENGIRGIGRAAGRYAKAYRVGEGWLLTGEGQGPGGGQGVPIVGYLGAGAEVEPDFEQVPPEGLDQIELPFALNEDLIAFIVKGPSMLPFYKDGTVIVVYREQKRPLESFYGEEAAVRTSAGQRFIKTIMRGDGGSVTLTSFNDAPRENVRLEWIGEIFAVLPKSQWKQAQRQGIQGQMQFRRTG